MLMRKTKMSLDLISSRIREVIVAARRQMGAVVEDMVAAIT